MPSSLSSWVFDMIFLPASGSKYVNNFRSPREFFLHACWLMKGADMDSTGSPDCECKYCDGTRTQGAIDRDFQLPGPKDSSHKSSGHHSGRHTSSAVTSEAIIMQAKDYRHLNKTSTGYTLHRLLL